MEELYTVPGVGVSGTTYVEFIRRVSALIWYSIGSVVYLHKSNDLSDGTSWYPDRQQLLTCVNTT